LLDEIFKLRFGSAAHNGLCDFPLLINEECVWQEMQATTTICDITFRSSMIGVLAIRYETSPCGGIVLRYNAEPHAYFQRSRLSERRFSADLHKGPGRTSRQLRHAEADPGDSSRLV